MMMGVEVAEALASLSLPWQMPPDVTHDTPAPCRAASDLRDYRLVEDHLVSMNGISDGRNDM
jgi:hypothetical protein